MTSWFILKIDTYKRRSHRKCAISGTLSDFTGRQNGHWNYHFPTRSTKHIHHKPTRYLSGFQHSQYRRLNRASANDSVICIKSFSNGDAFFVDIFSLFFLHTVKFVYMRWGDSSTINPLIDHVLATERVIQMKYSCSHRAIFQKGPSIFVIHAF